MPEFLPLEWRGHVRAFIRPTPSQKITTGGRALSGTQKTGTLSKNSNTKPTDHCVTGCTAMQRGSGGPALREQSVRRAPRQALFSGP